MDKATEFKTAEEQAIRIDSIESMVASGEMTAMQCFTQMKYLVQSAHKAATEAAQGGEWLIQLRGEYLVSRGIWVRPRHKGYTNYIHDAGRFPEDEAKRYANDLPNKYKAVQLPVTQPPAPVAPDEQQEAESLRQDALGDIQYMAGLQAGFSLGDAGENDGLEAALKARSAAVGVVKTARAMLNATPEPPVPVVPEALTVSQCSTSQYCQGWNECREAMLKATPKPDSTPDGWRIEVDTESGIAWLHDADSGEVASYLDRSYVGGESRSYLGFLFLKDLLAGKKSAGEPRDLQYMAAQWDKLSNIAKGKGYKSAFHMADMASDRGDQ